MKRYIKSTFEYYPIESPKMTTGEVAETLRRKYELTGSYTTRRGKKYSYRITQNGWVEVWWEELIYDGVSRNHFKSRYLRKVPIEVQNYLTDKYGEQLAELGIKLNF